MRIGTREAIRQLRRDHPDTWGKFSQANLERRFYEAKKQQRDIQKVIEEIKQCPPRQP